MSITLNYTTGGFNAQGVALGTPFEHDLRVDGAGDTPYGNFMVPEPVEGQMTVGTLAFGAQIANPATGGFNFHVVYQRFVRRFGEPIELVNGAADIVEPAFTSDMAEPDVWVALVDADHLCVVVRGAPDVNGVPQSLFCKFMQIPSVIWFTPDPNA